MNRIDELRQDIDDIKSGIAVETDSEMIDILRENLEIAESELKQAMMSNGNDAAPSVSKPVEPKAKKAKLDLPSTQVIKDFGDYKLMHSPAKGSYYFTGKAKGGLIGQSFTSEDEAMKAHDEVKNSTEPKAKETKPKKEKTPSVKNESVDIEIKSTRYYEDKIVCKGEIISLSIEISEEINSDDAAERFLQDDQNWIYEVDRVLETEYPKAEDAGFKIESWRFSKEGNELVIDCSFDFISKYDKTTEKHRPKSIKPNPKLVKKGDTLTWEKPVANDQLQHAELGMLTCDMKFITATNKVGVIVPIEAEAGDIIVLDAKSNRPMMVIKKQYAKRKCLTLKEGETAHVVIEKPDESIKQVVMTESGRKELPIAHAEDVLDEKATQADVETIKAVHQSDCTIAEYNRDMPNVPVRTWLEDMVERFNSNKTNLYVTKVLISKEGEVFARIANKSALGWMVTPEWYQICPDSSRITILQKPPKRGSYEVEVNEKEIREFYSDVDDYSKCSHWTSQIYKIRMGEVDGDKKALYRKWAESCRNSNLVKRYKKLHGYIHKKARKIREEKPNKYDTHYEAVRAVRAMLKKAEVHLKD